MPSANRSGTGDVMEVLDRILDRGIVIDAEMRFTVVGLTVAGLDARIVVAGIETYLQHADAIAQSFSVSWRWTGEPEPISWPSRNNRKPRDRLRGFLDADAGGLPFHPEDD